MTLREWWDRQLVIESWRGRGLSPANLLILFFILASLVLFTLETEPEISAHYGGLIDRLNLAVLIIFAAEFCLRIWSAGEAEGVRGLRNRLNYAGKPWLWIDFVAFAPELALIGLASVGLAPAIGIEWLKSIRLLRLLKLARFVPGGRLVLDVLRTVWPQLLVSLVVALTLIYLAAVAIYFAERDINPVAFGSVPRALWWSVVTLTTVGYGDAYPVTLLGRIIAGVIALVGVGIIALPSGIIAGAFMDRLEQDRRKSSEPK